MLVFTLIGPPKDIFTQQLDLIGIRVWRIIEVKISHNSIINNCDDDNRSKYPGQSVSLISALLNTVSAVVFISLNQQQYNFTTAQQLSSLTVVVVKV